MQVFSAVCFCLFPYFLIIVIFIALVHLMFWLDHKSNYYYLVSLISPYVIFACLVPEILTSLLPLAHKVMQSCRPGFQVQDRGRAAAIAGNSFQFASSTTVQMVAMACYRIDE